MADREIVVKFLITDEGTTRVLNAAGEGLKQVDHAVTQVTQHTDQLSTAFVSAARSSNTLTSSLVAGFAGGAAIESARLLGTAIRDVERFLSSSVSAFAQSARGADGLGRAITESNRQWDDFKVNLGGVIDRTIHLTGLLETMGGVLERVNGYLGQEQVISTRGAQAAQDEIDRRINQAAAAARAASPNGIAGGDVSSYFFSPEERAAAGRPDFVGPIEDPNAAVRRTTRNQEEDRRAATQGANEAARRIASIADLQRAEDREHERGIADAARAQKEADTQAKQALKEQFDIAKARADKELSNAHSQSQFAEEQLREAEQLKRPEQDIADLAAKAADARKLELDARTAALQVEIDFGKQSEKITAEAQKQAAIEADKLKTQQDVFRQAQEQQRQQEDAQRQQDNRTRETGAVISGILSGAAGATSLKGLGSQIFGGGVSDLFGRAGISLSSALSGNAVPTDPSTGLSTGIAGAGVPYAIIAAAVINGATGALEARQKEANRFGATDKSIYNAAALGGVGGVFSTISPALGNLFGKLGEKKFAGSDELIQSLDQIFTGGLSTILEVAGAFQAPQRPTQLQKNLNDLIEKNAPYFPRQQYITAGDRSGLRAKYLYLPEDEAQANIFAGLGFSTLGPGPLSQSQGDVAANIGKYGQPGVSGLRFGAGIGLGQLLYGQTGKPEDVQSAANSLINNLLLSGVNSKEAGIQLGQLAKGSGFDLGTGLQTLEKQSLEGDLKSPEQLRAAIAGVVTLFKDDLPRGIDAYTASLKEVTDVNGHLVFNANAAIADIQQQVIQQQQNQARIASGEQFAGNLGAVRDQFQADRFALRASTLTGRRQYNFLHGAYDTRTQASFNALAGIERSAANGGILTDTEQQVAGQAFQQAEQSIQGNINIAAQRYGVGTSAYNRAVAPYIEQLTRLDSYASLIADDTDRTINAYNAGVDKIVAAIEKRNSSGPDALDTKSITFNVDVNGAVQTYIASPQGVAAIQQANAQ